MNEILIAYTPMPGPFNVAALTPNEALGVVVVLGLVIVAIIGTIGYFLIKSLIKSLKDKT